MKDWAIMYGPHPFEEAINDWYTNDPVAIQGMANIVIQIT